MKKNLWSLEYCLRIALLLACCGPVACDHEPGSGTGSLSLLGDGVMHVDAAGGTGYIRYEILYPAAGLQVTACSDAAWITSFSYDSPNAVQFHFERNPSDTQREAEIVVSYGGDRCSVRAVQHAADPACDEEFAATMLTGFYYGEKYSPGMGDYWFFFTDKGFDEDMAALPDGTFYRVDLYAPLAEGGGAVAIPEGTYTLDTGDDPSCAAYTFSRALSLYYTTDADGDMEQIATYESGTLTVEAAPDGYRLELRITTSDGVRRRAVYQGAVGLKNEGGSGGTGGGTAGEFPALESDATARFDRYIATFLGSHEGLSEVNVQFSDMERDAGGNNIPPGTLLDVHFYTVLDEGDRIAEGRYTVGKGQAGMFRPGGALDVGVWAVFGTYVSVLDAQGHKRVGLVTGGTVDVVRDDGQYTVTFDLELPGGYGFTGSYAGPLTVAGVTSGSITTLTEDYVLDFTQGETVATANYWGDFYKTGTGNWTIDISRAPGSGQDDTFITDVCCAATGFTDGFAGVYTASRNNGASTFMPGYISGQNIMGTMYLGGFDANGYVTKMAPALSGRVEIVDNGDGTHTIAFDCYDDAEQPHNFRGTWTGPVNRVDQTAPGVARAIHRTGVPARSGARLRRDRELQPGCVCTRLLPSLRTTCQKRAPYTNH